jgi:hypothetical protein
MTDLKRRPRRFSDCASAYEALLGPDAAAGA